ncbi:MAG: pentapeptide repeat-containing protein [Nostocaceae cyanobacterium]|nr:pentapeptide repeat-containing protein [Nostocaceae cyanobacterium]
MATPSVRQNTNESSQSNEPKQSVTLPLGTRRFAAWVTEITLVVASGLLPFGVGVYANTRSDLNRVPLNPILIITERAIKSPLALPVSYGTRNVALPTNFLWTLAIIAPLSISGWQLYLLATTGSTMPKRWFGVKVVSESGQPPGWSGILLREGIGRWTLPMSVAYVIWRYSFAFPHLSIFTVLAAMVLLAEGTGFPWQKDRRALHDRLARTYTVDALIPPHSEDDSEWMELEQEEAIATEPQPSAANGKFQLWQQLKQKPSLSLLGAGIASMTTVLAILVGTQIYIQQQQNRRADAQRNREQFSALVKQFNSTSGANNQQRRSAILAMAALQDSQANKFLVELLKTTNNFTLQETIEQALVSIGLSVLPDLQRANRFLNSKLESADKLSPQEQKLLQQRLQANQRVINQILVVDNGKTQGVDLSRINLDQSISGKRNFKLALDKLDIWGVNFKYTNLKGASFQGSRFRGPGEDGRWDTYDDWITDLSGATMTQANLTDANLSRVVLVRTDLSRAVLNRANLLNARLVGANLSSTQLVGADLRGAVLEGASLTGADLADAKLNEADLYAARLGRAIAIGAQLPYTNLSKTDWQGADLSGANLNRANLSNANLSATRLTGAVLRYANLKGANFRDADLSLADLRGTNVAGADFQGAIFTSAKQDPSDRFVETPKTGTESAVVAGVDFTEAKNLDPKQLVYICTQGGIHPRGCP